MADTIAIVPFVEGKFTQAQGFATSAYQTTMEGLLSLKQIAEQLTLINRLISIDTTTVSAGMPTETPPVINSADFAIQMPELPPDPQIVDASVEGLPTFPDLVAGDVSPMTTPAEPAIVDASVLDNSHFGDLVVGGITAWKTPSEPGVTGVEVEGFPGFGSLNVGDLNPSDETYASSLLSAIKDKMLSDVHDGSTGLTPAVEDAIFKREYERSILVEQDLEDGIAADWSGRGWPLPSGALKAGLDQARINFANKRLDVSRDIMIKSFELALQNYHFIIQQGIGLESQLMTYAHSVAVLAFQIADATVKNTIAAFGENTKGKTAEVTAKIEKARIKIQYNASLIELFSARVQASLYEVQASKLIADATIEGFKASTQSSAEQSRSAIEKARIKVQSNEMLVGLLNARTNAARSIAEASKWIVDAQVAKNNAGTQSAAEHSRAIIDQARNKIEYNRGLIELVNSKLNAYSANIRGQADRVNAVARGYEAETAVFKAVTDFDISKAGLDLKVLETRINQAIANSNIMIKDKEIEQKNYELINSLKIEAMKALGAIAAQLVAGALSSAHAQASIGYSAGEDVNALELERMREDAAAKAAAAAAAAAE